MRAYFLLTTRRYVHYLQNYCKLDLEVLLTAAAFRVRLLFRLSRIQN